jgi:hypothetical protein
MIMARAGVANFFNCIEKVHPFAVRIITGIGIIGETARKNASSSKCPRNPGGCFQRNQLWGVGVAFAGTADGLR